MTWSMWIRRSLLHHCRSHMAIACGVALAAMMVTGALAVGDSIRWTLERSGMARLGRAEFAMDCGERFFGADLADRLAGALGVEAAPFWRLSASAVRPGNGLRAHGVQILGVDERFWGMAPEATTSFELGDRDAVVNEALAERLRLRAGDEFLVRVEDIRALPQEAPLAVASEHSRALRLRVKGIAGERAFGSFGFQASQIAPRNVYVSRNWLSREFGLHGRANSMLLSQGARLPEVEETLRRVRRLSDMGWKLVELPSGWFELRSERIFLEERLAEAALEAGRGFGVFTYLANELRAGEKSAPYCFVAASRLPFLPADMEDGDILVGGWLAGDLCLKSGDSLEMAYYEFGPLRRLEEKRRTFRVISSAGMDPDGSLTPDYPGLLDAEDCRDWEAGIPIDFPRIRKQDEDYWREHRAAPKAFVTLAAGCGMWASRFGVLTAVRYPPDSDPEAIESSILGAFEPRGSFYPAAEGARKAAREGVDFAQLFLGLTFFVVAAAMILTSLLLSLSLETRAGEIGTLRALGFTKKAIRRALLAEFGLSSLAGAALGASCGVFYPQVALRALGTIWQGAIGTSALHFHLRGSSVLLGFLCAAGAAFAAAFWRTGRNSASIRELQTLARATRHEGPMRRTAVAAVLCWAGAFATAALVDPGRGREAAGAFFAAGTMALIGGLAICRLALARSEAVPFTLTRLALRNAGRDGGRSLSVIAVLACAVFLVISVSSQRRNPLGAVDSRESGTGGFELYAETSVPIAHDLGTVEGREAAGLSEGTWDGVRFVAMRVHEGDDAGCLNVNRAQRPRLLGVDPEELGGSFTFVKTAPDLDASRPWSGLEAESTEAIPAVADQTSIVWGLGKSVGDLCAAQDESGQTRALKLVGGLSTSIFQGSILVSERAFLELYPSSGGARTFLVEAPDSRIPEVRDALESAWKDLGVEVVPCAQRLARFSEVENTYLDIFLSFGAIAWLLGGVGLAVVVLRNVFERTRECALLRALGFSRKSIRNAVLLEHCILLAMGLICGCAAAFVAVLPGLFSPEGDIPFAGTACALAAVAASGAVCTWLAARTSVREDACADLRRE